MGNKTVWESEPWVPGESNFSGFSGREEEMRLITAAWMAGENSLPMHPLLTGDPGVGKNRLVYELARQTGRELFILQGHEDLTAEDLACSVRLTSGNTIEYVASALLTAMVRGAICLCDEIGLIKPRVLSHLVSLLDERRYIDSLLLGERVTALPGFRFIAATNSSNMYLLPEYISSRMRPHIALRPPSREEVSATITRQFGHQCKDSDRLLDLFWVLWKNTLPDQEVTHRDVILLFGLASRLSAVQYKGCTPGDPILPTVLTILPEHLEQAFNQLFGSKPLF